VYTKLQTFIIKTGPASPPLQNNIGFYGEGGGY